jgi:ABC-type glycerol-3-phosphate transport system substrate-binding protein
VFSYWTSGSEASALDALFQVFKQRHPNVEVVNAAIAGGSGSAAMPVLQTRLAGGNPPDTWQSHPGQELLSRYVDPGFCQDVSSIYKSENWDAVVPKALVEQLSSKGKIYSVMTGVHRLNVLWYNKKVLDKNGIKIGDKISFADFFAAADKLKAAGVTPLAVGDSGIWASGDILENGWQQRGPAEFQQDKRLHPSSDRYRPEGTECLSAVVDGRLQESRFGAEPFPWRRRYACVSTIRCGCSQRLRCRQKRERICKGRRRRREG